MRTSGSIVSTARGPVECLVEGAGIPVVVLHGSPGGIDAADIMSTFLPRQQFRVVLLSRPGYLGTDLLDRETPDRQADLVAALLDAHDIDKASVFAWSGGGPVAYRFAVRHPHRTLALVTTAAVSRPMRIPALDASSKFMFNTKAGNWLLRVLAAHQPEKIVSGTLSDEGELTEAQLRQRTAEVMADETKRQFVLDLSRTVNRSGNRKNGYDADVRQFATLPDLELKKISAPTLLIHGDVDSDVFVAHTTDAAGDIPGARMRILPTGTHLALWTHPEAVQAQAEVREFLTASAQTQA